ncbi:phage integrase N-terminal domain-containing protein [Marinicella rhabdoformis]|uniref:phage integrase N-terminal domain-containing protein n=1 Tax=Marinicella rhabdoformis TaxID=2580566 RepID=UPI001C551079|nr:phage integrase N-terminal domain-containing protein [Marinicella rhabdoformis]
MKQIMKYNRDGSPDRQKSRFNNLNRCIKQLHNRGYGKRWDIHRLGKKEVNRLVDDWRVENLSHRTIANRMADIRWLADKVGKLNEIPSNKDIGCGLRKNNPNYGTSKAKPINYKHINQLPQREKLVTLLRSEFGLRTEEACKFSYAYATRMEDDYIALKGSWCKGGRPRKIAIVTEKQKTLLQMVSTFQRQNNEKSMIPKGKTFKSYYRHYNLIRFDHNIAGHGLRHTWAQNRFQLLSGGIKAPHAGGPDFCDLSVKEQRIWNRAASIVNQELGHGKNRLDITSTYIGAK